MEPLLTSVFGAGATQNVNTITIAKADLTNLTASANNTAESLLVAIVQKAQAGLAKTNFDTNLDQSVYIELGFPNFAFRGINNDPYRVDSFTINLAKPDTNAAIDPDDY